MKKVTPDPGAVRADPQTGSTVEVRGGLLVLHLRGTPYERGLAHGRLLRREIRRSRIASYFSDFLSALVGHSPQSRRLPAPLLRGLTRLLEWWYLHPAGVPAAGGVPRGDRRGGGRRGPGAAHRGPGHRGRRPDAAPGRRVPAHGRRPPDLAGTGGCSGAYARGAALAGAAHALLARNMDFPGALVWRHPVVIFSHPEEEVEMTVEDGRGGFRAVRRRKAPYVYVTAAGFPGYGLTGMSASGIAVADFVILSRGVSRRGLLSLDYNHWLLTRAESLAGVRHLAAGGRMRCATPHAALFAAEEGALAVEADAAGSAVRGTGEDGDTLVQTNHFLDPGLSRRQMDYPLEREHSQGRFRTLEEELRAGRGRLDVRRMIDLLALNREPASGGTRLLGDFPAQLTTLSSVVFEPGTGRFWAAAGAPPAVSYGDFEGFELRDGGRAPRSAAPRPAARGPAARGPFPGGAVPAGPRAGAAAGGAPGVRPAGGGAGLGAHRRPGVRVPAGPALPARRPPGQGAGPAARAARARPLPAGEGGRPGALGGPGPRPARPARRGPGRLPGPGGGTGGRARAAPGGPPVAAPALHRGEAAGQLRLHHPGPADLLLNGRAAALSSRGAAAPRRPGATARPGGRRPFSG